MQCPKCGSPLNEGQKFCTKCGQPIKNTPQQPQMPSKATAPQAPRPIAPQAPRPITPQAPRPMQPQAPHPVQPQMVQAPRPQQIDADDKGFLSRVGHGIAAAATGRSFMQGYEQQRNREHTYEDLAKIAPAKISDANKTLRELQKTHPGVISNGDELDVNAIAKKIQELLSAPGASEGVKNSAITKALKELDDKIYEIRVKCDPSLARQTNEPVSETNLRNRNVPVVQLHDVNEDELAVVQKKAIWGIQPGQIARRITERELDSVEGLNGFIIRDGCQAMIFVNGQLVNVFDEGAYNVPQRSEEMLKAEFQRLFEEMERQEKEKRQAEKQRQDNRSFIERGGVVGLLGRGLRSVTHFIFGASPVKQQKEKSEADRIKDLEEKVKKALQAKNNETVLSIVLVRKGLVNMTFGGNYDGDTVQYQPYTIPTKLFDIQIGVSLQLKVTDIHLLATNHLADCNSLTTNDVFRLLNQSIEGEIVETLRNVEYEHEGLSESTRNLLKQRIQSLIDNRLRGIVCDNVERITDRSEDFDRFRAVERQLYCSEKELDYLQRTGEVRNRMEQEQNRQLINSAQNKEDYSYAMQQIDKDHLLHQDEWDDFVRLLEAQRIIKQSTSDEEVYEALLDLQKNRLVKDNEYAAVADAVEHDRINRNEITEIMRIQANENISMADMRSRFALGDFNQEHEWEREDLARKRNWGIEDEEREREWVNEEREYDRQRNRLKAEDDYDFEVMMRQRAVDLEDHDRERRERIEDEERQRANMRQDKFDDDQLEANRSARQMQNLEMAMKLQMQQEAQEQQHAENMATIQSNEQMNRDNNFANMSAEQIRAAQLSHLTGDAQVAMANAYGNAQQQAEQKVLYEQMIAQQNAQSAQNQQMMMQMAQMMQQGMMGVAGAQMNNQQQQIDQLRADKLHAEERQDHAQDQAFTAMGGVATAAASNLYTQNTNTNVNVQQPQQAQVQQPEPQMIECQCYNCHKVISIPEGAACCPECGAPFQW